MMSEAKRRRIEKNGSPEPSWKLRAITSIRPVEFVEACVGVVDDKKNITHVMKHLADQQPLEVRHSFLKRVKVEKDGGVLVLLTVAGPGATLEKLDQPPPHVTEVRTERVPDRVPATRAQFDECRARWPCRFHEDKHLEALLAGRTEDVWGDEALRRHGDHMTAATECGDFLLVDPATNRVLCRPGDGPPSSSSSCAACSPRVMTHPAMRLIASVARLDREGRMPDGSYLCTGRAVYLAGEPCLMCAMALVHARVARVFFGAGQAENGKDWEAGASAEGELVSMVRQDVMSDLNHSFQVFECCQSELTSAK